MVTHSPEYFRRPDHEISLLIIDVDSQVVSPSRRMRYYVAVAHFCCHYPVGQSQMVPSISFVSRYQRKKTFEAMPPISRDCITLVKSFAAVVIGIVHLSHHSTIRTESDGSTITRGSVTTYLHRLSVFIAIYCWLQFLPFSDDFPYGCPKTMGTSGGV